MFEESCARSCPKATNCSAPADVEVTLRSSVKADKAVSDSICSIKRRDDSKCFMDSSSVTMTPASGGPVAQVSKSSAVAQQSR